MDSNFLKAIVFTAVLAGMSATGKTLELPKPEMKGGMPLMEALAARKSSRDFTAGAVLTAQELSNLLWAANGVNSHGTRTAPSAVNAQAVDIYVFSADGIYRYEPREHGLRQLKQGDFRGKTGMQPFVASAAVNLVFVYDSAKFKMKPGEKRWASADGALCVENVYLYCASAGLKTVVRGSFDAKVLGELLGLRADQVIVLCQSVGK